jgi:hypothetical protein
VLDYLSIPFHCARCHIVGYILGDYHMKFYKYFKGSGRGFRKEDFPSYSFSDLKENSMLMTSPHTNFSNSTSPNINASASELPVPMNGVPLGPYQLGIPVDILGDDINLITSQWNKLVVIWSESDVCQGDYGKFLNSCSRSLDSSIYFGVIHVSSKYLEVGLVLSSSLGPKCTSLDGHVVLSPTLDLSSNYDFPSTSLEDRSEGSSISFWHSYSWC